MNIRPDHIFQTLPNSIRTSILKKASHQHIAFPESQDPRVQNAAQVLTNFFDVKCTLIDPKEAQRESQHTFAAMEHCFNQRNKVIPKTHQPYACDPTFYAGALLARNQVDAVVAGCVQTTAHVIRAALSTVGTHPAAPLVTSCFLFALKTPTPGGERVVLYSDCAVLPTPTSPELVDIAYLAQDAYMSWTNQAPRLSFLSFSTMGSASHPAAQHVKEAWQQFQKRFPYIQSQGEVQFDAAAVPEVAQRKLPGVGLEGKTNVFIFPNLNSANIAYKMTQWLAGGNAWGPILLGCSKPFSDLSRGATVEDIVHTALLTAALKK